ncbi:outer dynein arm-docking complex subunit 2 isoform X2 [Vespa velutina]|uniref:outer dynein arm-docking complex subunit 2 isoform X2 n=1 Tax=Vespa velutina TaxID=202808 RepID=UPI001FB20DE5|nr:outer dynein arm-docking complex subunit 2 isoform X2 [Vespa velutina]
MPPKKQKILVPPEPFLPEFEPDVTEIKEIDQMKPLISIVTGEPFGPKIYYVREKEEDESSDDEPESEGEDDERFLKNELSDISSDFWIMQKLIKYMKAGNQTATTISLCLLKDYDLTNRLDIMDIPDNVLQRSFDELNNIQKELVRVAIGGARALNSIAKSPKIKAELQKYGVVQHMARFLKSVHTNLIIPIMGTVQQCADLSVCRFAFEQMGIIADIVYHLKNEDMKLKENCALAIFKCAINKTTSNMVREAGGLDPLCKLIQDENVRANKHLLIAVTGAIWKCAVCSENVKRFNQNNLVAFLVPLLQENEEEDVLSNVVGALAECCKDPTNRDILRAHDGLPKLIKLLSFTYEPLLENIPLVLKECAENTQCMDIINDPGHKLDGVRLIWSLLKHPNDVIKTNACLALVPCIKYAKDSPEMVRAFVGGLELTVSLLDSTNPKVLSAVCATIASIALDPENLGILTDHGVVAKLARLAKTENEDLRANLTLAIAYCCEWDDNSSEFGKHKIIAPLVGYMNTKNKVVLKGVCIAMYHLSKDAMNCVTMHSCGIIKHMLRLIGSEDPEVQIAAASTIRHIRKLALTAERLHFKEINLLEDMNYQL